jgi:predicted ATPase
MKYVITGGPCSGKTALIERLASLGYETVRESARDVIEREQRKDSDNILPWTDLEGFQRLVMEEQRRKERAIKTDLAFLDRSYVDCVAYAKLGGVKPPQEIDDLVYKTGYTNVFLLAPLDFYESDTERKETPEKAMHIGNELYKTYCFYLYNPKIIPAASVDERVEMVLGHVKMDEWMRRTG